ncbi:hypothetical protein SAMN04488112_101242 [Melghirimyces thermohalophilus]|uniref:Uncharacterized protein n=2 Tax=Thermoactinomycetaceae TaxID=186824 RepID=A0A1N7QBF5_9BACL|nr:hypothetical protein SAMN04488112_101242 [Melghirimyces thermohalophilus]SIT20059.1 hypothetical protein SAMN05421790_12410 [Kroppenstedtia eburnea]
MQYCPFDPRVTLLLIHHSDEKVPLLYDENPYTWSMPKIGQRPPYYFNPRYEPYYPVI